MVDLILDVGLFDGIELGSGRLKARFGLNNGLFGGKQF